MDLSIDVADAQVIMCNQIDAWRTSLGTGFFTWNGNQWDCDQTSQNNIIGACVLAVVNGGNLPAGYVWRTYTNVNVPVTGANMIAIGVEMFTFISATYQAAWQHKANVMALTDTPSVAGYDYTSTLWPDPTVQL